MEQLEFLEAELKMLQENIKRIRDFQSNEANKTYVPYNSRVIGEFKHRIVALKQRLTLVSNITTRDLFN
jgi:hypothetical protein